MQTSQTIRALTRNDSRLVMRDSFLIMMTLYSLVIAVALRYFVPWLASTLLETYSFDLTPYYAMITGWLMITIGPQLAGTVFGYLLLAEKEENTLKAIMVTPLSLGSFLSYRVLVAAVFGFGIALASVLIIDLIAVPFLQLALISAVAALYAPLCMLFYASVAGNSVEAFALLKITAMLSFLPIAAWFLAEPWQYLAGIFPPYWATKALWVAADGGSNWWLYLVIGTATSSALIWWLGRRFEKSTAK